MSDWHIGSSDHGAFYVDPGPGDDRAGEITAAGERRALEIAIDYAKDCRDRANGSLRDFRTRLRRLDKS